MGNDRVDFWIHRIETLERRLRRLARGYVTGSDTRREFSRG